MFIIIYSISLRNLKLIVLRGALETLRHLYSVSYLVVQFFIATTFESDDMASKTLHVTVSPSRVKEESRRGNDKSTLTVTIFSRGSILDTMILEAREKWMSARSDKTAIYAGERYGPYGELWNHIASRPKRPLNLIVLDEGIKELLLDDARDFMKAKNGIPFRREYLPYGAPGSGKTSIIHSLAGELGLGVHMISLCKVDDVGWNSLIFLFPEQCVAIMEDIDAAFTYGITRDISGTDLEDPRIRDPCCDLSQRDDDGDPKDDPNDKQDGGRSSGGESESSRSVNKLTLSGLLNALDGISAQEGLKLFATTNRYHTLDPALTRPDSDRMLGSVLLAVTRPGSRTAASTDDDGDDVPSDSTLTKEGLDLAPPAPKGAVRATPCNYSITAHLPSMPKLSRKLIEHLAERFASRIPEREFSMASLQGYLTSYMTHHFQAADDVDQWIEDTREARDGRTEVRALRVQE
ncbi:P-loop containing nucleoside triphosphate hydrolase protein [Lactarius hatsudake]|nr:P-loop containing nucleoside triphosphate hydrolase protein [Lactarius hatsudake]